MEKEKKKTIFLFVFSTYLPVFLHKFRSGELVHDDDVHDDHIIIIMFFSDISYFWGSKVRKKYAEWVLVGWEI